MLETCEAKPLWKGAMLLAESIHKMHMGMGRNGKKIWIGQLQSKRL
jgi:hypothetical protein